MVEAMDEGDKRLVEQREHVSILLKSLRNNRETVNGRRRSTKLISLPKAFLILAPKIPHSRKNFSPRKRAILVPLTPANTLIYLFGATYPSTHSSDSNAQPELRVSAVLMKLDERSWG